MHETLIYYSYRLKYLDLRFCFNTFHYDLFYFQKTSHLSLIDYLLGYFKYYCLNFQIFFFIFTLFVRNMLLFFILIPEVSFIVLTSIVTWSSSSLVFAYLKCFSFIFFFSQVLPVQSRKIICWVSLSHAIYFRVTVLFFHQTCCPFS